MADYTDLNLNRESLDVQVQKFVQSKGYGLDGGIQVSSRGKRVVFGAPGIEFATVDLLLNKNGTTTVHWRLGKNQAVGEELAIYLKSTINPAEFDTVNYSLKGITSESFDPLIDVLKEAEGLKLEVVRDDDGCKQVGLISLDHQDSLKLTHHRNTRVLQIQGKPLSCYRRVIFLITDLLDLKGLEQVLYRKDDGSAEIVRKEMAENYLRQFFQKSYDALPQSVKKLLISSCCVKLASPTLPDYCLLLYPDLRSLEGILKQEMLVYDISVGESENGFGKFFNVVQGNCKLRPEYEAKVNHSKMVDAFNIGYSLLRKHRNTIFHMEEYPDGSRMIDTLDKAIGLSNDVYGAIDGLLTARM